MSISDSSSSPKLSNVQTSEPIKPQSKARKGQSEAEFLEQKQIWENTGPVIQETNSLLNQDHANAVVKIERSALRNAAERCLYLRNYDQALEILEQGMKNLSNEREKTELENLRNTIILQAKKA